MKIASITEFIIHPPPEVGKVDTSIRFTDILFGFAIKEIFIRLANWELLPLYIKCHLAVTSALVLGSWIGYRRSANRSAYEVKFINLPLIRFVTDQLMLIMYFRLAIVTPLPSTKTSWPSAAEVTAHTMLDVAIVFGLYVIWDTINVCMAGSKNGKLHRYPKTADKPSTGTPMQDVRDWTGFWISLTFFLVLGGLYCGIDEFSQSCGPMLIATTLLILYRVAKEIRTSYRHVQGAT